MTSKPIYKVVIIGAESTGKTILAENLAKHFNTCWVPEFGREYVEQKALQVGAQNLKFSPQDFITIAKNQLSMEDKLTKTANRIIICDSNLMTTCIWSEFLLGSCSEELLQLTKERKESYHLWLLANINVPWVQDGTRLGPDTQWFHERFLDELKLNKINHVLIDGNSWEKRTALAISAIDTFLNQKALKAFDF